MKWTTYKKLTKSQQEEWVFRFGQHKPFGRLLIRSMNSVFTIFGFIAVLMALLVITLKENPEQSDLIYRLWSLVADTSIYYFFTWAIVQVYLIIEFVVRTYQEIKFVSDCKKPRKLEKNYEPEQY